MNNHMLNPFKACTESLQWPEEIAHLKGRVLVRKKDGASFRIVRPDGQCIGRKPAAYLEPVGDSWPIITRSHWKTYAKILIEMKPR